MNFQHAIFEAKRFPTFFYFEVNTNVLCSITGDSYNKRTKNNTVSRVVLMDDFPKHKTTHTLKHGNLKKKNALSK